MAETCLSTDALYLDNEYFDVLPEEVLSDLTACDQNHDDILDFKEVQGAELMTPGESLVMSINTQEDFNVYTTLTYNWCSTTKIAQKFGAATSYQHEIVTESWLETRSEIFVNNDKTSPIFFECVDTMKIQDSYYLLIRAPYDCAEENFYFTLRLPIEASASSSTSVTVEFAGQVFDVQSSLSSQNTKFAIAYFKLIGQFLNMPVDGIPSFVTQREARKFEALTYQASLMPSSSPAGDTQTTDDTKALASYDSFMNDEWPEQGYATVSGIDGFYTLPIVSDKALSPSESKMLALSLQAMPKNLIEVIARNGTLARIEIGILDDDVLSAGHGSTTGAVYDKRFHTLMIRRSNLAPNKSNELQNLFKHEFGHAIFSLTGELFSMAIMWASLGGTRIIEDSNNYFINDIFLETQEMAATDAEFPSVSIYSLDNCMEFFTECVVAYTNGEEDKSPFADGMYGPRSRAELREYLPEMYVALRLFMEPESRYFGNAEIFSQDSRVIIQKMIDSPLGGDLILSPKTSAAQVAQFYLLAQDKD